jgi:putative phage-type endonuclease
MDHWQVKDEDIQVQRSDAWLKERKKRLGASEVASILGISPYKSKRELWLEKTGRKEPFAGNWATNRGTEAEPTIKALYESLTGKKVEPIVLFYEPWPTLMASLDGITSDMLVVEFKYPSKKVFDDCTAGIVPPHYMAQVQVQLMCAKATEADFVCFDGSQIAITRVKEDKKLQEDILVAAKEFWGYVENDTYPNDNSSIVETLEQLDRNKAIIAELEEVNSILTEEVKKLVKDKEEFGQFSCSWSERKVSVKYKDIPELNNVDLDQYRSASTKIFSIRKKK